MDIITELMQYIKDKFHISPYLQITNLIPYFHIKGGYEGLSKAPPMAVAASTIKEGKSLCYCNQFVTVRKLSSFLERYFKFFNQK